MTSLNARVKDLLQRAADTDSLSPRDHSKQAHIIHERRDALQLLQESEEQRKIALREFIALEARVFELVTIATRGPSGHSWLTDLPQRENGSAFYQALRSLARHLAERTRIAQMTAPPASRR